LSSPQPASTDVVVQPVVGAQVRIASDGTDWLLVWLDTRQDQPAVFGTRVFANGTVEDPSGHPIVVLPRASSTVPRLFFQLNALSLAWNGSEYLLVLAPTATTILNGTSAVEVRATRLSRVGVPLDPTPFSVVASQPGVGMEVAAASDGTDFLVAWIDVNSNMFAGRVSAQGVPLDGPGIQLNDVVGTAQFNLRIVWDQVGYIVGWTREQVGPLIADFHQRRVGADAVPVGPSQVLGSPVPSSSVEALGLATSGSGSLLTWSGPGDAGTPVLFAELLDHDGGLLPPGSWVVNPLSRSYGNVNAAWNGTEYVLKYQDSSLTGPIFEMGVLTSGATSFPERTLLVSDAGDVAGDPFVSAGSTTLAALRVGGQLSGVRIGPGGMPLDAPAFSIGRTAQRQRNASVAFNGASGVMMWQEDRNGATPMFVAPLDGGLTAGTPTPVLPGPDPASDYLTDRFVCAGSEGFLAAWNGRFNVSVARVDARGVVLDSPPITWPADPTFNQAAPAPLWFGDHWIVLWSEQFGLTITVYAHRVELDGGQTPAGDAGWVAATVTPALTTVSATNGDVAFVVSSNLNLAFRIDRAAHVLDPAGVPLPSDGGQYLPAIASNGSDFLLVWGEDPERAGNLLGMRIAADGGMLDPPPGLALASGVLLPLGNFGTATPRFTSVTWDGETYVLSYLRDRPDAGGRDVFVQRVASDGGLVGPPVAVTTDALASEASVTGMGRGQTAISYAAYDPSPAIGMFRLYTQVLYSGALGTPCGVAGDCRSGFCVDGLCCDSACGGGAVDCLACSVANGATADGTCSLLAAGAVCRPAAGSCDVAEACSGIDAGCPPDVAVSDGTACDDGGTCAAGDCREAVAPSTDAGPPTGPVVYRSGCGCGHAGLGQWLLALLALSRLPRRGGARRT
jgi:hypothetical protein